MPDKETYSPSGFLDNLLSNSPAGSQASVQTKGEVDNPHGSDNHTDGWAGTKNADGSVSVDKMHSTDK